MSLTVSERVAAFVALGKEFNAESNFMQQTVIPSLQKIYNSNGWFTDVSVLKAMHSLSQMLLEDNLVEWLSNYKFPEKNTTKKVGLIMAGNIPLVGFHDLLCILTSGNIAIIKTSKDDAILPRLVVDKLIEIQPLFKELIFITDGKLEGFDAVIATGSNNTARYFELYFGKYPNIIRKGRTSVAVLSGNESSIELTKLGNDVFDYFGLGCRNVSKLYVPKGYNFSTFFESVFDFGYVANVNKYANNYDYNRAVYLMNSHTFLDNNFLIVKENKDFSGPVAVLNYQQYDDVLQVRTELNENADRIQCVVSSLSDIENAIPFGKSQTPMLWDYADGVDTLDFLIQLNN